MSPLVVKSQRTNSKICWRLPHHVSFTRDDGIVITSPTLWISSLNDPAQLPQTVLKPFSITSFILTPGPLLVVYLLEFQWWSSCWYFQDTQSLRVDCVCVMFNRSRNVHVIISSAFPTLMLLEDLWQYQAPHVSSLIQPWLQYILAYLSIQMNYYSRIQDKMILLEGICAFIYYSYFQHWWWLSPGSIFKNILPKLIFKIH